MRHSEIRIFHIAALLACSLLATPPSKRMVTSRSWPVLRPSRHWRSLSQVCCAQSSSTSKPAASEMGSKVWILNPGYMGLVDTLPLSCAFGGIYHHLTQILALWNLKTSSSTWRELKQNIQEIVHNVCAGAWCLLCHNCVAVRPVSYHPEYNSATAPNRTLQF